MTARCYFVPFFTSNNKASFPGRYGVFHVFKDCTEFCFCRVMKPVPLSRRFDSLSSAVTELHE